MNKNIKLAGLVGLIALLGMAIGMLIGLSFCGEMDCGIPIPQQIASLESNNQIPDGYRIVCNSEQCEMALKPTGLMVEMEMIQ